VDEESCSVALTFDDGPDPSWTPAVLDALARADARASFFVVTEQIERAGGEELVREITAAGHEVQLHGATHTPHPLLGRDALRAETSRALDRLAACGVAPRLWRPPFGRLHPRHSVPLAAELGLQLVLWSHDAHDYDGRRAERMLAELGDGISSDAVVVMHDSRRYAATDSACETVALIGPLVSLLRQRGFRVGPLHAPVVPRPRRPGETTVVVPLAV
jgi:peptidoglycan-N-acetylglucosamine deacetylase